MSFRLLCKMFDDGMPFREKSNLGSESLAQRLHWVSEGIIGKLANLLRSAGYDAINDGCEHVTIEHLAQAYERMRSPKAPFNPFIHDWSLKPTKQGSILDASAQHALSKRSAAHA